MSQNLRKLFVAFEGNTKKIAWFAKQYPSYEKFVAALEAAEWKVMRLEKLLLDQKGQADAAAEKKITDGAADRKRKAASDARDRATAASVGNDKAKLLLQGWFELQGEFQARGYDNPKAAAVDLSYLEMGTSKNVGDAAAVKSKTFAEDLLEKEPLIVFIGKVSTFLATAKATLEHIQGKAGVLHSYKDSIAEVQRIVGETEKMSAQLAELFSRSAPKSKPMKFSEQNMVPSAKDLGDVQQRLADVKGIDTPSQAWALTGADKKGQDEKTRFRAEAVQRLIELNKSWGTSYKVEQLDTIMKTLVGGRITTNYFMSQAPGANLEQGAQNGPKPTPLVELLMKSKNFKNVWETGKSQASADLVQRGGVEEAMGYGAALHRTGGTAQTRAATKDGKFEPKEKGEMPKYSAVTSKLQKDGVAPRYGKTIVVWKEALRERITHTPGDSWNMDKKGVGFLTSGKHPEVIFANADEELIRLAAAEATGSDGAWLAEVKKKNGLTTEAYVETQIHGDLTWSDVAEILVGEDDADTVIAQLKEFAKKEGHDFKVRAK